MFLSTNLLGFFVRGFFPPLEIQKLGNNTSEVLQQEIKKFRSTNKIVNIVAFLLIIGYFYLLSHFWNIGITIVAGLIMIARLPDLLWEIKTGKKITIHSAPKSKLGLISSILLWGALPLLYYFLYLFK
jgi:hypothetical protein